MPQLILKLLPVVQLPINVAKLHTAKLQQLLNLQTSSINLHVVQL